MSYERRLQVPVNSDTDMESPFLSLPPTPGPLKDKEKGVDFTGRVIPGVPEIELDADYQQQLERAICAEVCAEYQSKNFMFKEAGSSKDRPNEILEAINLNAADELQSNAGHNSDSDSVASSKRVRKCRAQKKHQHSRELKELGDFKRAVLIEDAIHREKKGRHRYCSVNTPPALLNIVTPSLECDCSCPLTDNAAAVGNISQAVTQIPKDSYLGQLMINVGKLDKACHCPDPSSSSSSSGSSSSSSSSAGTSSHGHRHRHSRSSSWGSRRRRHRHSKNKRWHNRHHSPAELAKPIKPETYNGSERIQDFTCFMHEATDYIQTARIKPECQVLVTARFLEGKAQNFYMQRVAKQVEEWSLQAFFAGLFNDIFHFSRPLNSIS